MIDLQQFCGNPISTPGFDVPFSDADYTYASERCIIVRVAFRKDIPLGAVNTVISAQKLFSTLNHGEPRALPEIPSIPVVKCSCPHCQGCIPMDDPCRTITIGTAHYQSKYLRLIATLPNPQFAESGENDAAWFKFDGGDGLLMPIRK